MPKRAVESTGFLLYWVFLLSSRIGRKSSKANKINMSPKVEITSSSRLNVFDGRTFFLLKSLSVVGRDAEVHVTALGLLTHSDNFTSVSLP